MIGHTDDRGQLILAGAVVFSLVLIGIVVVFSTTLFTANMASSSTNAGITDAGGLESDVEATVEDLIEASNEENEFSDVDEFSGEIDEVYNSALSERYADSGPTIVSVEAECVNTEATGCANLGVSLIDEDIDSVDMKIVYETRSTTTERTIEVDPDS